MYLPNQAPGAGDSENERNEVLFQFEGWGEKVMVALGVIWLLLLIADYTGRGNPFTEAAFTVIWIVFIVDFVIRFTIAPRKRVFLATNALTAVSLAVPAVRILKIARLLPFLGLARATRGLSFVRLIGTLNRNMRGLGNTLARRGFGYVVLITIIVILGGGAGIYLFERHIDLPQGLHDYWTAVWWTAMIITTMGSEYWPRTAEGRLLNFLLAVYAFAIFGYVTATLASYFVDKDAETLHGGRAKEESVRRLREEIAELRRELEEFRRGSQSGSEGGGEDTNDS